MTDGRVELDGCLLSLTGDPAGIKPDYRLLPHQHSAADKMSGMAGCLLADDTGLGKTRTVIAAIQASPFFRQRPDSVVIVAAPGSILQHKWVSELAVMGECAVIAVSGSPGDKRTRAAMQAGARWIITGYEAAMRIGKAHRRVMLDVLAGTRTAAIILDEAHHVKSWKAKRTKAWSQIIRVMRARNGGRVFALTATPLAHDATDIVSIMSLVGRVKDYWMTCSRAVEYEEIYVSKRSGFVRKPTGWNGDAGLQILFRHMIRRMKRDVLTELSPLAETQTLIAINSAAFTRAVDARLTAWLAKRNSSDEIATADVAAWINQSDQTASQLEAISASLAVAGELKAPAIAEYLADNLANLPGAQIVVFVKHKASGRLIEAGILDRKVSAKMVCGSDDAPARQQAVDDFRTGKTQALIMTYGVGAVGIDLTEAQRVILAELDWSPVSAEQARNRIHRIGQTGQTICETMIARDGDAGDIEQAVIDVQRRKIAYAAAVGLTAGQSAKH